MDYTTGAIGKVRLICLGTILFAALSVLSVPVRANIYLSKAKSGGLKVTNTVPSDSEGRVYKLILESRWPESADLPNAETFRTIVQEASKRHDVPEALIYSVIEIESDGDTTARSEEGALGLMQLMPATARDMGVEDPMDPRQNIFGGARYLRNVLNQFDGDLDLALAAYNAGPGTVRKHGGIPPIEQTQQFVKRVTNRFEHFKSEGDMVYTYRDEDGVLHVTNIH